MLEIEKKIFIDLIELSESLNSIKQLKFIDFSSNIYINKIKILISVLIENEFITDEDNDEIVLECIIIRDLKKMDVDISDSQGLYYFRGNFLIDKTDIINIIKEKLLLSINTIQKTKL